MAVAELDEEFAAMDSPDAGAKEDYERRRGRLISLLRERS
jgi:hypothetical protein